MWSDLWSNGVFAGLVAGTIIIVLLACIFALVVGRQIRTLLRDAREAAGLRARFSSFSLWRCQS